MDFVNVLNFKNILRVKLTKIHLFKWVNEQWGLIINGRLVCKTIAFLNGLCIYISMDRSDLVTWVQTDLLPITSYRGYSCPKKYEYRL